MDIKAVIFDLDGVIVSTDEYHYRSWKRLADEEGIYFDREINNRLRGVSRMAGLEVLLERAERSYSEEEKAEMAARKNVYYRDSLGDLSPSDILPGTMAVLEGFKNAGIKVAVGSSSKNCGLILGRIGLSDYFDAVVDGNDITRSKPDPEVFIKACDRLGMEPARCLVVEDAKAGVEAAVAGGMPCLAVGSAAGHPGAWHSATGLDDVLVEQLLAA